MRRLSLAAFSLTLALTSACSSPATVVPPVVDGGDDGVSDDGFLGDPCKASVAAGAGANVSVGHGQNFFETLADGATLTWEKGPQGGHHVWVALRMIGLRLHGTIVQIDLDDVEDPANVRQVGSSRVIYNFEPDEGGHCVLVGQRAQLDNAGGVTLPSLLGHHVRITAKLSDPDHAAAADTKTVVVTGALD